jgi:hypothetical protein
LRTQEIHYPLRRFSLSGTRFVQTHFAQSHKETLDDSAMKALKSWKFEPALKDGIPYDCAIAVELDFPSKSH